MRDYDRDYESFTEYRERMTAQFRNTPVKVIARHGDTVATVQPFANGAEACEWMTHTRLFRWFRVVPLGDTQ